MFDCFGAGQVVSQQLFAGIIWRDAPDSRQDMFASFKVMTVDLATLHSTVRTILLGVSEEVRAGYFAAGVDPADGALKPGPGCPFALTIR